MKHPSHFYIKFLILQGCDKDQVNTYLKDMGLPPLHKVALDDFTKFRQDLLRKAPEDFNMYDDTHAPSVRFCKQEQIHGLVSQTEEVRGCLKILESGQAKRDVTLALIGRLPTKEVVEVCAQHGIDVTAKVLEALQHYYLNVPLLTIAEWATLIPTFAAKDTQQMMSTLEGGPSVAAYKLGLAKNATIKDTIQIAVDSIQATIMEIRHWPASMDKVKMLSDMVTALAKAHDVMNTSEQELASVAKELRGFKMARAATKPVPLKILTGGK